MENQRGYNIKILRTDRGGEYVSYVFLNFCKTHGIDKKFTMRYTPNQNGVTERKNMTIIEMECSMMEAKHFPNEYSNKEVITSIYIMNRCLTKSVENKVP